MTNYTFNGSVLPLADYDDTIRAVLTTSTNGTLLIQGLTVANGNFGTFVNGLKLVPNVGPSVSITGFGTALDGNLQVTAQGQYNNQPIGYQYSLDLSPGSWKPVLNGMVITNIGSTEVFEIPITTNQQFFRAVGH